MVCCDIVVGLNLLGICLTSLFRLPSIPHFQAGEYNMLSIPQHVHLIIAYLGVLDRLPHPGTRTRFQLSLPASHAGGHYVAEERRVFALHRNRTQGPQTGEHTTEGFSVCASCVGWFIYVCEMLMGDMRARFREGRRR